MGFKSRNAVVSGPDGEISITVYCGDETWHDGPGWYYVYDDYPVEGSCGVFLTWQEAVQHARKSEGN